MTSLFALDSDRTMKPFGGPISPALIRRLMKQNRVVRIGDVDLLVVFPSMEGPTRLGIPVPGFPHKSQWLAYFRSKYPGMEEYVVVDNSASNYEGGHPGWTRLTPAEFVERYR